MAAPMIVLASCFRDAAGYVNRWAFQVEEFRHHVNEQVVTIVVEGDSTDDTYQKLTDEKQVDVLLRCEHGGPKYGSVVHPQRWRQLAAAGNVALCAAVRMNPAVFVYVESDLMWGPHMMRSLVARARDVTAVAPMSMFGGRFYDVWGHVKNGRPFKPYPPYYDGWHRDTDELTQIDSAGSCFALTGPALAHVEFSKDDCIRGIGRSLRAAGFTLWLDPTLEVRHP